MITSKYVVKDGGQGPTEYNAMTLSSDEVSIKAISNSDWEIFFTKNPKVSLTLHFK